MTPEELDIANGHLADMVKADRETIAVLRRELAEAKEDVKRLTWIRDAMRVTNDNIGRKLTDAEAERDAAQAEAGRMREALSGLVQACEDDQCEFIQDVYSATFARAKALATPAADASRHRPSKEWLRKAAENDDCGIMSVGGLAVDLGLHGTAADFAPDEKVREVGRRLMETNREMFQKLAENPSIIAEHWLNEDLTVSTLIPKGEPHPGDPKLTIKCCEIIGKNWEECMKKYDKHMGF